MKNDSLRQAIAREEAQLADLTHKHNESRERLAALKTKLVTSEATPAASSSQIIQPRADIPTTAEGKISLFRQLFRGRDDVFPLLWMSSKTGRRGYGKHHASYVDKLNKLITDTEFETAPLEEIINKATGGIFNNAAQVWNHTFYWNCLSPDGGHPRRETLCRQPAAGGCVRARSGCGAGDQAPGLTRRAPTVHTYVPR